MRPALLSAWLGLVAGLLLPGCGSLSHRDDEYAGLPRIQERQEVVTAALSQVGTPYRYGGVVPGQGLDCSGLAQVAHLAAGVRIPRVSTEQQRAAERVVARSPGPGDLVFFQIGPGQYHVGLMIDRDRFVHASTSRGRVLVSSLSTPYWRQHYRGAGSYLD